MTQPLTPPPAACCIHCQRGPSGHSGFARCPGGETQYTPGLDPLDIIHSLLEGYPEDACFWILTSAAAYLDPSYNFDQQDEGSTAAYYFWDKEPTKS